MARSIKVRFFCKAILILSVLCLLAVVTLKFLSLVPRERAEQAKTLPEKALIGGKKLLSGIIFSSTVPEISKHESHLPSVEIYIRGEKIDALNSKLPESGREFQNAKVKLNTSPSGSSVYEAKVRYRGDSINHWAFPQKSWRVQLRGAKVYDGRRIFNLYLPRTESRIADYLGYEMGKRIGLISPSAYPVHFRLNRQFDGTRIFLEQVDQSFLTYRGLDAGYIYIGDITTEQIYSPGKRKSLFHQVDAWTIDGPNLDRGVADPDFGEKNPIKHLLSVLNRKRSIEEFLPKIREIIDTDTALAYIALLEIVGSNHVDDTHNHKWYLNPRKGVLQPIVWDTAAYMWGDQNGEIDLPVNTLFEKVVSVPEFHHQKHQKIWQYINSGVLSTDSLSKFINDEYNKIKNDVEADPFKLTALHTRVNFLSNKEFHLGVVDLLKIIKTRNEKLIAALRDAKYHTIYKGTHSYQSLSIINFGTPSIKLKSIKIPVSNSSQTTQLRLERLGTKSSLNAKVDNGYVVFALDDFLYSRGTVSNTWQSNKKLPARYEYRIVLDGDGEIGNVVTVTAQNGITGEDLPQYTAKLNENIANLPSETLPGWWSETLRTIPDPIKWSGEVNISSNLILPEQTDLIVAAGTTVNICSRCSIIVRGGKIIAEGTPEKPIIFRGNNSDSNDGKRSFKTIGVLGISGLKRQTSRLSHVRIEGGSEGEVGYVYYRGSLALHGVDAQLNDVTFAKSTLGLVDSHATLKDTKFLGGVVRAISNVNSSISEDNATFIEPPILTHDINLANSRSYGTPVRSEREYRYGITSADHKEKISVIDGEALALAFNAALVEAVKDTSRWNAPKYTQTPYRIVPVVGESVYRDIYFDTDDYVNKTHHVSYRLRNRFKDKKTHDRHIKSPLNPDFWPYRIEFQGKTGREADDNLMTTVKEARFEFRRQSSPFSIVDPPPPPPWPLPEYIPILQSGRFGDIVPEPARHVMEYYKSIFPERKEYAFKPKTVVSTTRRRQHLEIRSPWGSGPNPDQAYIITLDHSQVYDAVPFIDVVKKGWNGEKVVLPPYLGEFFEVEVEFERNVSSKLDQRIAELELLNPNHPELANLRLALRAFVDDQKVIVDALKLYLGRHKYAFSPVFESKYRQSLSMVEAN
jgi:hypothetical protein